MIPLKLTIKNFLSYASTQEIDFTKHNLICLSGKNGHGKSAILDAFTWALWGQARKIGGTVKSDLGVMRLGCKQTMVRFDFLLEEHHYCVRREAEIQNGKLTVSLDFGMVGGASDGFISLTDKTIKATQLKIDQTVRLTFESFVNSAFLRQGQSNEFSKKSAKERKEVFSDILGLSFYDELKQLALEKARQATNEHQTQLILVNQITQQLINKPTTDNDLVKLDADLKNNTINEEVIKIQIAQVEKQKQEIEICLRQKEHLLFKQEQLQQEVMQQRDLLKQLYCTWKIVHKNKQQNTDYQLIIDRKRSLDDKLEQYHRQAQDILSAKEELLLLKTQAQKRQDDEQAAKRQFQMQHEQLNAQTKLLENTINQIIVQKEKIEVERTTVDIRSNQLACTIAQKNDLARLLAYEQAICDKRKAAQQEWTNHYNWLTNELNQTAKKEQLVAHNTQGATCPLCEQNLSTTHREFLRTKLLATTQRSTLRINRLMRLIKTLKTVLVAQNHSIEKIRAELERITKAEMEYNLLLKHQLQLNDSLSCLLEQINHHELQKQEIKKQIVAMNVIHQESMSKIILQVTQEQAPLLASQRITQLEAYIATNRPNQAMYEQLRQECNALQDRLCSYEAVNKLSAQQELRTKEIEHICNTIKKNNYLLKSMEAQRETFEVVLCKSQQIQKAEQELHGTYKTMQSTKETLMEQKGKLEAELHAYEYLNTQKQEQEKRALQAIHYATHYQAVAHVLGKDGIQALLIEDAIPEIEDEANRLLSKLTNNQAHLFVESLRDLKKGGARETLDIKISDPLGIRPYEMFSGGEAFRIDFALRIAISKLLTRRAGATLQMLIIDEGFGSQDEEGLVHIMEVIHALQNDFEKIIIVSHLDTMKEQFPVHFHVEKDSSGSKVHIIEQG